MHVRTHALRFHSERTSCYQDLNLLGLAADMARVSTCMSSLAMSFIPGELDEAAAAVDDSDVGADASMAEDDDAAAVAAGGDSDVGAVAASGHDDVAAAVAAGGVFRGGGINALQRPPRVI